MTATADIVTIILSDHEQVKRLLAGVDQATPDQRKDLFWELTNELVRHEVAEEETVYPVVRKELTGGEALAEARIAEQAEAEQLLKDMEGIGPEDAEWLGLFRQLHKAVLAHAEKEETQVFALMSRELSAKRREEVAGRYEKAKATAPTHPHPMAPDTPPGNVALGPVAALVDRARDAMHHVAS